MDEPAERAQPVEVGDDAGAVGGWRHRVAVLVVAAMATVVAGALVVPRLADDDSGGDQVASVEAGPAADVPTRVAVAPAPSRVQLDVPAGWQTLHAAGDRLVVATHALEDRDLLLALLARDDASFAAFPTGAAVFVVGSDRLKAKYVSDPAQATRSTSAYGVESVQAGPPIGPGPEYGLGPAKVLAGGVTVRRGDLPRSSVVLAAYVARDAPPSAVEQAEAMAAAVRLPQPDRSSVPPPPPGSRPGFDAGGVRVDEARLRAVASVDALGAAYTVRADGDCAVVTSSRTTEPVAGGCAEAPAAGAPPAVVATTMMLMPPPPPSSVQSGAPDATTRPEPMAVLVRASPATHHLTAATVDGGVGEVTLGADGWGLLATEGRAYLIEARDDRGTVLAQSPVA